MLVAIDLAPWHLLISTSLLLVSTIGLICPCCGPYVDWLMYVMWTTLRYWFSKGVHSAIFSLKNSIGFGFYCRSQNFDWPAQLNKMNSVHWRRKNINWTVYTWKCNSEPQIQCQWSNLPTHTFKTSTDGTVHKVLQWITIQIQSQQSKSKRKEEWRVAAPSGGTNQLSSYF